MQNKEEKYGALIAELEEKIIKASFTKEELISQTFIVWYTLTEGIQNDIFEEGKLKKILNRNKLYFINEFKNDPDCNFIYGWMLNISFWYFEINNDNEGNKHLYKAYRTNPENILYRWSVRDLLNLSESEIGKLADILKKDFVKYFPHNGNIKDYFMNLLE